MNQPKIRVLIADNHSILRQGLRRILDDEPDMEVVGEASTGSEAIQFSAELDPDILLMDVSLPEPNGIECTRQISATGSTRVLMLTVHDERQVIASALTAGASGYLLKDSVDNELVTSIRTIHEGGSAFSARVTRTLANLDQAEPETHRSLDSLTAREKQVFYLLADGKSSSQIAAELFVSPKTIHTHRQHIMDKLGIKTIGELIRYAIREGLIETV